MNDNLKKSVEILRNTKLKQGVGSLFDNGCFCAVGAILYEKNHATGDVIEGLWPLLGQRAEAVGVSQEGHDLIIDMNDVSGMTFEEIAGEIEKDTARFEAYHD